MLARCSPQLGRLILVPVDFYSIHSHVLFAYLLEAAVGEGHDGAYHCAWRVSLLTLFAVSSLIMGLYRNGPATASSHTCLYITLDPGGCTPTGITQYPYSSTNNFFNKTKSVAIEEDQRRLGCLINHLEGLKLGFAKD